MSEGWNAAEREKEILRLRKDLATEKEESASYHRFWIEARDDAIKLAEEVKLLRSQVEQMRTTEPVAWQRRFKHSTNGQMTEWGFSRLSEQEFRDRFGYLIEAGECEVRYLGVVSSATPSTERGGAAQ